MTDYSVAEAKNNLSKLIDRAIEGETVRITRHGKVMVHLTPPGQGPRPVSPESMDWLDRVRIKRRPNAAESGSDLVSRMRDEDWR